MKTQKLSIFRRLLSYTPNMLRLSVFIAACYGLFALFSAKMVEAEVREIMLGVGAELMAFPDDGGGEVRQVTLNGATIQMRTGMVARPLEEVLDHYEQMCQRRDGQLSQQIEEISEGLIDVDAAAADGTLRWHAGDQGFVTCLDMGEERVETEGLLGRLNGFIDSGNLSEVGQLRYLYATEQGENTHLVTIWTDGDLNLYEMFPTDGSDATGADFDGVPRIEGSQRILSAAEDGRAYGVATYFCDKEIDEIANFYRTSMTESGWSVMENRPGERVDIEGSRMLTLENDDNRIVSLVITPSGDSNVPENIITVLSSEEE